MGYDLLAGLLFAAILPLVVVGFVAFWAVTSHERAAVAETWRVYAAERGLAYTAPEGAWPNRTSPVITWTAGEVAFRLEPLGKETHSRTRLTVRPRATLLGRVSVAPRSGPPAPPHGLADPVFAATYRVVERPSGLAGRLLTEPVRRGLLGFRQGDSVTLGYRRGRAVLEWPGGELNDARLDEARRLGATIARAVEEAFRTPGEGSRDAA